MGKRDKFSKLMEYQSRKDRETNLLKEQKKIVPQDALADTWSTSVDYHTHTSSGTLAPTQPTLTGNSGFTGSSWIGQPSTNTWPSTSTRPVVWPPSPPVPALPIEGIDELASLLGVEPVDKPNALGTNSSVHFDDTGVWLAARDNKFVNLTHLIQAQVELMARLNILLVHRNISRES